MSVGGCRTFKPCGLWEGMWSLPGDTLAWKGISGTTVDFTFFMYQSVEPH